MANAATQAFDKDAGKVEGQSPESARLSKPADPYAGVLALQDIAGNRAVDQLLALQAMLNRNGGQPLDPAVRAEMETRFDQEFGQVRVHTEPSATASAEAIHAAAYTVGQDVVFAAGEYAPNTSAGQQLLAHELAHVVQQGRVGAVAAEPVSQPGDRFEGDADRAAAAASAGRPAQVAATGAPPAVQRQEDIRKRLEEIPTPSAQYEPESQAASPLEKPLEKAAGASGEFDIADGGLSIANPDWLLGGVSGLIFRTLFKGGARGLLEAPKQPDAEGSEAQKPAQPETPTWTPRPPDLAPRIRTPEDQMIDNWLQKKLTEIGRLEK